MRSAPRKQPRKGLRAEPGSALGRLALGLMAGTSLDGVDAALVRLSGPVARRKARLLKFVTIPYPAALRERLFDVAGGQRLTAGDLSELNVRVGDAFARAALSVCGEAGVQPERLAVIGSHGQTVFHQGCAVGSAPPSTLQIGEPAVIAERTGAPVVADFRSADIAAGGEGAPLVPMADYLLLADARRGSVALNLGGIANLTVIPAGARPDDVFGFDTGPGNMVMDELVRHCTGGRRRYDAGGHQAARGKVIEPLLAKALCFPFFERRPPRSAGREEFGSGFVTRYFLSRRPSYRCEDLLRTAAELTARSIAGAIDRFVFPRVRPQGKLHRLVISGGGAHNGLLVERLQALLPALQVRPSDDYGWPVDAKEAMAFALLAERTVHGLAGNLPGVTGARRPVVLGTLTMG
ncbi:MAG TPA: anhydro-N-acetylmuramic acid kinase [Terriglobia bacterium]|nr:anhydro-N-acetylmuramic acid kinase [Terriglobia bacterium]